MAGQYESPDYGQFTSGNFSFGDTWGSGQGLNQGQYQSLADALGYTGDMFASGLFNEDDPMSSMGYQAYLQNPSSPDVSSMRIEGDWLNPEFKNSLSSLKLQNSWDQEGNQNWNIFGKEGNPLTSFQMYKPDDSIDQMVGMIAPALFTGALGGGLSTLFGGGVTGGALGQGLASGTMSSAQGGSFGKGFLSGAIGGGLQGLGAGTPEMWDNISSEYIPASPGTSLAGAAGITNPTLAGMFNRGAGSFLGGLAGGKSGSEALKGGLTGAALSGINSVGSSVMTPYLNSLKGWLGDSGSVAGAGADPEFDSLMGSGGDMSEQTDVSPNRYAEMVTGNDGMETFNPDFGFGGDQLSSAFSGAPDQRALSSGQSDFSLSSLLGNAGGRLGNFALNNAGDLASMLYGFYNNRKQQKALGQQVSSLQGLYGQNSPYAAQLRNKLNAQAAATGRRSNVAGRETQLQAMLADRSASLAPTLMQLNQARGQLKNSMGSNTLSMLNKMGAFQGLAGLFKPNTYTDGGANITGMQNPYGSDVVFNGWGG